MSREYRDFRKVVKVLKSCVTLEQIDMAQKMYENYQRMYPDAKYNAFDFHYFLRTKCRHIRNERDSE